MEKKQHDYKRNAEWRDKNRAELRIKWIKYRTDLKPAYVAQCMRMSVKDLTPEILETAVEIESLAYSKRATPPVPLIIASFPPH